MSELVSQTIADLFADLPDRARVWVYCTDRALTESEADVVNSGLKRFLASWKSHGRTIHGAGSIVLGRFVVIAGDIPGGDVSGCGIDASTRTLNTIAGELGFGFLSALDAAYRIGNEPVKTVSRAEMKKLVSQGALSHDTRVFDFSVPDLGRVRAGTFDPVLGDSWYARFLGAEAN